MVPMRGTTLNRRFRRSDGVVPMVPMVPLKTHPLGERVAGRRRCSSSRTAGRGGYAGPAPIMQRHGSDDPPDDSHGK
jgi:hypothetical protein